MGVRKRQCQHNLETDRSTFAISRQSYGTDIPRHKPTTELLTTEYQHHATEDHVTPICLLLAQAV
jgi:hypothetical protein